MPGPMGPRPGHTTEKAKDFKKASKNFINYCQEYMPTVIIALILATLGSVCSIVGPNKLKELTDTIVQGIMTGIDMDKVKEVDNGFNHGITLVERKNIVISGVKKIESFDSEEFLMETTLGYLVIKGNELEIIKLDTYQGNVSIKGKIDSMVYLDSNNKKDNDNSLLNKLFK